MKISFRQRVPSTTAEPAHAASFLRDREIWLDRALLEHAPEALRIVTHELFHFVWLRLDNASRREWSQLLADEMRRKVKGELGWSAEWRKQAQPRPGTRVWRDYVCESFCDTAAWFFSSGPRHEEHTLAASARPRRRQYFRKLAARRKLPV